MARLASQAVAGYFPTPPHLVPLIAQQIVRHLRVSSTFLDPCAGDGEAVCSLADHVHGEDGRFSARIYGIEMEAARAAALQKRQRNGKSLHSDAFHAKLEGRAGVLYLNPPYEFDREYGRLEHKFLERFTGNLARAGVLVFVVPYHALKASARYLAEHYERVQCVRFPEPEWDAYHQVVLYAARRQVPAPFGDPETEARVNAWADDPTDMPVLGEANLETYTIPSSDGFSTFVHLELDIQAVMQDFAGSGAARVLGLEKGIDDLVFRVYPVANKPKPGHIVQALASNLLSGQIIRSNNSLPPLLVNGVFEREYVTESEKLDKKGKKVGEIQVQQPKFRLSVLNLKQYTYHDIRPGVEETGETDLDRMTVADIIQHYDEDLTRVMLNQCPPLHDPDDQQRKLFLPETMRIPYQAQSQAIMTALKLLHMAPLPGATFGTNPFVLGEVGSGKSTIALIAAWCLAPANVSMTTDQIQTIIKGTIWEDTFVRPKPVERVIIVCPPHLVKSWSDQIDMVLPGATPVVVEGISDLDTRIDERRFGPGEGMVFYLISQSTAKLGGSLEDGRWNHRCPRCGQPAPGTPEEIVNKRRHCEATTLVPGDPVAHIATDLAHLVVHTQTALRLVQARYLKRKETRWKQIQPGKLETLVHRLMDLCLAGEENEQVDLLIALELLILSIPYDCDDLIEQTATVLYPSRGKYDGQRTRSTSRFIICMMRDTHKALRCLERLQLMGIEEPHSSSSHTPEWAVRAVLQGDTLYGYPQRKENGVIKYLDEYQGTSSAANKALDILVNLGAFEKTPPCDEPLYQHVSPFRGDRWPVATYVARQCPDLYQLVIVDEGHEARTLNTAVQKAVGRLVENHQAMLLTGTLSTGKASGLHILMWMMSQRYRQAFGREDTSKFVTRYGYRKRLVEEKPAKKRPESTYGATTDRVSQDTVQAVRQMGETPGILPLFWIKELAPCAIHLHKYELDDDLPQKREVQVPVEADEEQRNRYEAILSATVAQARADMFSDMAGRLFGALGQIPSYLDRCHRMTGNEDYGRRWNVRYPASGDNTLGSVVASADLFDDTYLTPKERKFVSIVKREIKEGRRVLVFVVHVNVGERLRYLLSAFGIQSVVLSNVETKQREKWINTQVIQKEAPVLITHYQKVQTGLNNLVYFSTGIWFEPGNDGIGYRQANGRLHRPGQKLPVDLISLYYRDTAQAMALDHLARKVRSSMLLDGLDVSTALEGAGAGDRHEAVTAIEFGKLLYQRLAA